MRDSIATAVRFANLRHRYQDRSGFTAFRYDGNIDEIKHHHRWIGRAQFSDGPAHATAAEYSVESLSRRQIPGKGVLPLVDFVRSLPDNIVAGLEVPCPNLPPEERIARAVSACCDLSGVRLTQHNRLRSA